MLLQFILKVNNLITLNLAFMYVHSVKCTKLQAHFILKRRS